MSKNITTHLKIPLGNYLKMAEAAVKAENFKLPTDPIKRRATMLDIAKHQSVIHQEPAFDLAREIIQSKEDINISVEPVELDEKNETITYEVRYVSKGPNEWALDGFIEAQLKKRNLPYSYQ